MATTKSTTSEPAAASADDFKTEQEKNPGGDPVSEPVEPGERVEVLKTGAKEPYPTGNPRDPEDDFAAAHGFRRAKS